jgi:2'-5' RNA ligase
MRLFVALPIPQEARREIGTLIEDLRRADGPVRWVGEEGIHLTLKFLGEVPESRVPEIGDALRQAASGTPPLAVTLTEAGGFPTLARARVIWLGLAGPPALELLAHRVAHACDTLGFPPEARVFHPHLTLGRLRDGARPDPELIRRLESMQTDLSFDLDTLCLFSSRPGAGGSSYTPLATFLLAH